LDDHNITNSNSINNTNKRQDLSSIWDEQTAPILDHVSRSLAAHRRYRRRTRRPNIVQGNELLPIC